MKSRRLAIDLYCYKKRFQAVQDKFALLKKYAYLSKQKKLKIFKVKQALAKTKLIKVLAVFRSRLNPLTKKLSNLKLKKRETLVVKSMQTWLYKTKDVRARIKANAILT